MTIQQRIFRLSGLVIGVAGLVACGKENADLHQYIQAVKQRQSQAVEPIPEFKAQKKFTYHASGVRSPFQKQTIKQASPLDPKRPKELLEAFPLDSLKMVGAMARGDIIWGLVLAPTGRVHRVGVGNYLGKHHGRITHISRNQIEIAESVRDGVGKWVTRTAILKINIE